MPPFVPTDAQRHLVAMCSGFKMPWDEIRLLVINERTKLPISKETLQKHFVDELQNGKAQLKRLIQSKVLQHLASGS
jgi:hypothetical protein